MRAAAGIGAQTNAFSTPYKNRPLKACPTPGALLVCTVPLRCWSQATCWAACAVSCPSRPRRAAEQARCDSLCAGCHVLGAARGLWNQPCHAVADASYRTPGFTHLSCPASRSAKHLSATRRTFRQSDAVSRTRFPPSRPPFCVHSALVSVSSEYQVVSQGDRILNFQQ